MRDDVQVRSYPCSGSSFRQTAPGWIVRVDRTRESRIFLGTPKFYRLNRLDGARASYKRHRCPHLQRRGDDDVRVEVSPNQADPIRRAKLRSEASIRERSP